MESKVTHGGLTVQEKLGSRMSSWGKLGNINLAHDSHRNVATPRSGHECGTRSRGLESGHGSSEFVVKTWGGFPYWRTVINP